MLRPLNFAAADADDVYERHVACASVSNTRGPMAILTSILITMLWGIPAMLLHEAGHIVAALWCGVKVKKVGLSRTGLYTVREAGPKWSNVCISLAGPL